MKRSSKVLASDFLSTMKRSTKVLVAAIAVCLVLSSLAVDEAAAPASDGVVAPTSTPISACIAGYKYKGSLNKCLKIAFRGKGLQCPPTSLSTNPCFFEELECDPNDQEVEALNLSTNVTEKKCETIDDQKPATPQCDGTWKFHNIKKLCFGNDQGPAVFRCPNDFPVENPAGVCRWTETAGGKHKRIKPQKKCPNPQTRQKHGDQEICESKMSTVKAWSCLPGKGTPIDQRCVDTTPSTRLGCDDRGYTNTGEMCNKESVYDVYPVCYKGTLNRVGDCGGDEKEVEPVESCPTDYPENEEGRCAKEIDTDDPSCLSGGTWDENGICL